MEYMIHTTIKTLIQILMVLGFAKLCLLFVPRTIRKTISGTFKLAYKVTRFVAIQLKIAVKKAYVSYKKETAQPKKRKYSPRKNTNPPNVIQFPKSNVK